MTNQSIIDIYLSYWKHILNWQGRATRFEFWISQLGTLLICMLLKALSFDFVVTLLALGNILAFISVTVRRLHDMGKSGFFVWKACLYTFLLGIVLAFIFAGMDYLGISVFQNIQSVIYIIIGYLVPGSFIIYPYIYALFPSQPYDNKYGPH
ncbi:MAG: DUF805 domain-containing protein [Alphaproteobacteria bacterium]|nr:DUF805 domain-containing protein [Alphaproteobacteria bacterium]